MKQQNRFNIRVYGIWIADGQVLVCDQQVAGRKITKFPGGGLEWGEGTKDCLIREWSEEIGTAISVKEHLYTTDFFQLSAFDHSQVISIYYRVEPTGSVTLPYNNGEELFYFSRLDDQLVERLSLPIDKIVGEMLF